jgi:hypothetical protein
MKTRLFLLMAVIFFSCSQLFAQVKSVNTHFQKKMNTTSTLPVKKITTEQKKQVPPQAPLTDLQSASVSILTGDDGKDNDTYVFLDLLDNNKRVAATYNNIPNSTFPSRPNDEYYAGASVSFPMKIEASVPTGETKLKGSLPLPVLREANISDFSNGGEVRIKIQPNGHDTWKIQTVSITFSFNNDSNSPHKITWSNIVLSQNGVIRDLLFDKNFNPIQ